MTRVTLVVEHEAYPVFYMFHDLDMEECEIEGYTLKGGPLTVDIRIKGVARDTHNVVRSVGLLEGQPDLTAALDKIQQEPFRE